MRLYSFQDAYEKRFDADVDPEMSEAIFGVADWVHSYLAKPHHELGRDGPVCPCTVKSVQVDTVRIGCCGAGPGEVKRVKDCLQECFAEFERIPSPRGFGGLRALIMGFPNCGSEEGMATIETGKRFQRLLALYSLTRPRMLGYFHPNSQTPGLHSASFKPFRAPVPTLVIREFAESDGPIVARNLLMIPMYLYHFKAAGAKRLLATLKTA